VVRAKALVTVVAVAAIAKATVAAAVSSCLVVVLMMISLVDELYRDEHYICKVKNSYEHDSHMCAAHRPAQDVVNGFDKEMVMADSTLDPDNIPAAPTARWAAVTTSAHWDRAIRPTAAAT
jgi:choline-glycine betaine transporter